jgi:hypothetical protein
MLADALQVPRARLMGTVRRAVGGEEAEAEPVGALGEPTGDVGGTTVGATARIAGDIPRELPPDLADPSLDVRVVVAELVAGPKQPYRAAIVRVETPEAAIRAAHHASAKFTDGQLYADLTATPPVAPAAVLRRFLRSLNADRPAEATADELAATFRSALAGRRMLVVLVGARSEAQIRPLIPAEAQCALLVAFATEGRPVAQPPFPARYES